MANPAADMLNNFDKLDFVSVTIINFHHFKLALFWQFCSFARLKIQTTVKACV
jgi:hypothetical protein